MTDLLLDSENDLVIEGGSFQLITDTPTLIKQRLLNKLSAFTGNLFTNINYGLNQELFFDRGTKSLLDQNIKELISTTKGVISLVSFTSTVLTTRVYQCSFTYSVETGEISGIENLTFGTAGIVSQDGIWKEGIFQFNGIWDDEEIWGEA